MAVTVVAQATFADDVTGVSSKAIDTTNVLTGDIMVCLLQIYDRTITLPSGWTPISSGTYGTTVIPHWASAWKVATGNAPTETFTFSGAGRVSYAFAAFRGGDLSTIDVTAVTTSNSNSFPTLPGTVAFTAGSANMGLQVAHRFVGPDTGVIQTTPTGYTTISDARTAAVNTYGPNAAVCKRENAGSGASGSPATWGRSQNGNGFVSYNIYVGPLAPPANSVAPAATGTPAVASVLSCSTGTWTGSPAFTYQWKRNGSPISLATANTYTVVAADKGKTITCTVTASNAGGSASAASNGLAVPADIRGGGGVGLLLPIILNARRR